MDTALWAATIAAVATLTGYLLNQSWSRRERRAKIYAEALAAMRGWEEVPYVIWRRPASDSVTRGKIGQELTDAVSGVRYYVTLLRLESDVVGTAYEQLWSALRPTRSLNRSMAWQSQIISTDAEMDTEPPFATADADAERALCLLAMRRELSLLGPLLRVDTRRRLWTQKAIREATQ